MPQDTRVSLTLEKLSLCFYFHGLNGMHFPLEVSLCLCKVHVFTCT